MTSVVVPILCNTTKWTTCSVFTLVV